MFSFQFNTRIYSNPLFLFMYNFRPTIRNPRRLRPTSFICTITSNYIKSQIFNAIFFSTFFLNTYLTISSILHIQNLHSLVRTVSNFIITLFQAFITVLLLFFSCTIRQPHNSTHAPIIFLSMDGFKFNHTFLSI